MFVQQAANVRYERSNMKQKNGNSSPLYPLDNQKIDLRTWINDF